MALPALHLFTGNDYTSAFYRIGKVKTLKILIQSEHHIKTFKAIGDQFTLNAELFPLVEQFVFELYGLSQSSSATKARYKHRILFIKEITRTATINCDTRCPVVSYEKSKLCDSINPKITDPLSCHTLPCENYGWIIKDGLFQTQWILRKPARDELFELMSCSSRKSTVVWVTNVYVDHTVFHVRTSATPTPVKTKCINVMMYLTKMKMKLK